MIKYYYDEDRNVMKKWLLNPPTAYHDAIIEMVAFSEYYTSLKDVETNFETFKLSFNRTFANVVLAMIRDCEKDLGIKCGDEFLYLLYALTKWLIPSERLKMYKIHLKKIELSGDFTK